MDKEMLNLLIQPSLTILGWIVMIIWAIKQINIANGKSLELQRVLIKEKNKQELAKEIITIYKDISESLDSLHQAGNSFINNLILENSLVTEHIKTINFSAMNLVDPINQAYNKLGSDISRMDTWIELSSNSLSNTNKIRNVIMEYRKHFSYQNDIKPIWLDYQAMLATYQSRELNNHKAVYDVWKEISEAIIKIEKDFVDAMIIIIRENLIT
jgi:hypothetical protein